LQCSVVNLVIPSRFLTEQDRTLDIVNPEYEARKVQDQMLLVWLKCTLSKSVLSHVLGASHFYEVWDKIHEYFVLQTKSRARQLCIATCVVRLESKSMEEYLLKIKSYVSFIVYFFSVQLLVYNSFLDIYVYKYLLYITINVWKQ